MAAVQAEPKEAKPKAATEAMSFEALMADEAPLPKNSSKRDASKVDEEKEKLLKKKKESFEEPVVSKELEIDPDRPILTGSMGKAPSRLRFLPVFIILFAVAYFVVDRIPSAAPIVAGGLLLGALFFGVRYYIYYKARREAPPEPSHRSRRH